jgi:Ni/Fe-hydrogenase subunit HybB-like protein
MSTQQLPPLAPLTPQPPVIAPGYTFATVSDQISSIVLTRRPPFMWIAVFSASVLLLLVFLVAVTYLFIRGVGIWGINIPVGWAFAITNFVWWVGIGHAGTLISAILLLLRQKWRNSINRSAEAMTVIAVMCAGLFPLLHLGRPWLFYWLFPYPNTMSIQPQFRSPLVWDVFAVSTYFTVSFLFWFAGMIPDLATLRDRAQSKLGHALYGILAFGWRGDAKEWQIHETASLLLAGLATPLVLSVHTVVSFDFTIAILPGWHSTIFPPYFVAGAIYSGFAMVLVLAIPLRAAYGLQGLITGRHLENSAKLMLAMAMVLAYAYLLEVFIAWYSGDPYEMYLVRNRAFGPYAWVYWGVILCAVVIPQALWFNRVRSSASQLFAVSLVILLGMWLERFMIIVISLHRDFLPSAWAMYYPTFWDYATMFGTIGVFFFLFCLFIRFLPMISIYEVRALLPQAEVPEEAR